MRKVFLKLDGIGGATGSGRADEIEIASFYWGGENRSFLAPRRGGHSAMKDLTIIKRADRTSPYLRGAARTGRSFDGRLTLEDFSNLGGLVRSIVFELGAVFIDSVTDIDAGEVINLRCKSIKLVHSSKGNFESARKERGIEELGKGLKNMRRNLVIISIILAALAFGVSAASAQFNIKLPDININKKPKDPKNKETNNNNNNNTNNNVKTNNVETKRSNLTFPYTMPTNVPVFLKTKLQISTVVTNEYWKMKGQSNFSSWVPKMRFSLFYNNDKPIDYGVEYYNPDGSLWYSEKLEWFGRNAERTIDYESGSPFESGAFDTKSTNGTGVYGFKITNLGTNEVLVQGKFKVGKFSIDSDGRNKNKMCFYVDHDWVMPYAQIGFHHAFDGAGAIPILANVWLKGDLDVKDLEGRVFYKGQQITSTREEGGGVGVVEERNSDFAAAFQQADKIWKRYELQWNNFRMDGNGDFNHENFPRVHWADKNPGDYTIKIYKNGAQIRELTFTVGADGRFVTPAFSNQIPLPYYRFIVPVKIIGTEEKWSAAAWKTESFYGNPVSGFAMQ